MPLDDTARRAKPGAAVKPDVHAERRAELDRNLAALLARAKTTKSGKVLRFNAASLAVSQSEAWREAAKKDLIASGVLPDYARNPLPAGTVATIYADPLVILAVKVTQQASRLNADAFVADLAAAGVKAALLRKLRKRHTTEFNGAHTVTALLTG
jgi:hypothetical protein